MKLIRRIGECVRVHVAARLRTRYTRALEDEVARLRAENRALVNSVLGIAGIPPMRIREAAERANAAETPVLNTHEIGENSIANAEGRRFGTSAEGRLFQGETAAPVRRRSWQQIERALEVGDARAARLERESNTDAFPAPRNVVPRA